MNLLLLQPDELRDGRAEIAGSRAEELIAVHALTPGLALRAGIAGGPLGRATIEEIRPALRLVFAAEGPPPPRLPVILAVGISRPQTIKKVIQAAVTLGVTELHFVRCELAEKSYLKAQVLQPESLSEEIELALAQAVDTVPPRIDVHDRFRPFFEDTVPTRIRELHWEAPRLLVADTASGAQPFANLRADSAAATQWVLAVGPEAGWSPFESGRLSELGFVPVSLGPRILRVETAVTALLAQTALLLNAR